MRPTIVSYNMECNGSYAYISKAAIEHANKLVQQYYPQSHDFNAITNDSVKHILKINRKPRENHSPAPLKTSSLRFTTKSLYFCTCYLNIRCYNLSSILPSEWKKLLFLQKSNPLKIIHWFYTNY